MLSYYQFTLFIYKCQMTHTHRHTVKGTCEMRSDGLQAVDDGSVLEVLHVLFGLVKACLLLYFWRRALHQLDKVVTVNFVHDAKHPPAVVTDPLQVVRFAGVRLSCRRGDGRGQWNKEGMR